SWIASISTWARSSARACTSSNRRAVSSPSTPSTPSTGQARRVSQPLADAKLVPDEAGRIRRAIGALIILIGVLWILLAGGCTLVYAGASIFGITSGAANNASPDARYAAAYDTMILPI